MRKLFNYTSATHWTIPVILSLALLFGCAHDQEQKDPFVEQWKMTAVDEKAQELWDVYTEYKNKMFAKTKEGVVSWKIIKANRKTFARVDAINHVLRSIPYDKNRKV